MTAKGEKSTLFSSRTLSSLPSSSPRAPLPEANSLALATRSPSPTQLLFTPRIFFFDLAGSVSRIDKAAAGPQLTRHADTSSRKPTPTTMIDDEDRPASSLSVAVPSATAMLVEFPGYVRDVRAALEVLGGEQVRDNLGRMGSHCFFFFFFFPKISTSTPPLKKKKQALAAAAEGRAKYLTARLRPGDPLSHPLVSSAVQQQQEGEKRGGEGKGGGEGGRRGLLVRVSKKKQGEDGGDQGTSTTTTVTTVAAVVSSGVSFPGLADVQYAGWDARAPRSQAGRSSSTSAALAAAAGRGGGSGGGGGASFSSSSHSSVLPGEPLLAVPPVFFASDVAPAAPVVLVPAPATTTTTGKAK